MLFTSKYWYLLYNIQSVGTSIRYVVEFAWRRFAMLSVGVPCHVVARAFRRMMRLRRYMLRSAHVRLLAVDRLLALRRACEFRTGNTIRWGKCVSLYSFSLSF
jgi:hypothetical protein